MNTPSSSPSHARSRSTPNAAFVDSLLQQTVTDPGAKAITQRRRLSNSFQTMSTGSLVSNSPFTRGSNPPSPVKSSPTKSSPTKSSPIKDVPLVPKTPPLQFSSRTNRTEEIQSLRSQSPMQRDSPFRPSKPVSPATSPAKSRPQTPETRPRRNSSSFAVVRNNNLVSSSPFMSASPSPLQPTVPLSSSPPKSSKNNIKNASGLGVSNRVPSMPVRTDPTVDHRSFNNTSPTPPARDFEDSESSIEILDSFRENMNDVYRPPSPAPTLKHKASTKTVTWATTEEVLEFDVDEGRSSMASSIYPSDDGSVYDEDSSLEQAYPSVSHSIDYNEDESYDEGGSLVVHRAPPVDEPSPFPEILSASKVHIFANHGTIAKPFSVDGYASAETESTISTASTTSSTAVDSVEDVIDQIDNLIKLDQDAPRLSDASSVGSVQGLPMVMPLAGAQPIPEFKRLRLSNYSDQSSQQSEESFEIDHEHVLSSTPTRGSLLPENLLADSSTFSLPDLPKASPFNAFADNGEASSVTTLDLDGPGLDNTLTSTPLSLFPRESTPTQETMRPLPRSPRKADLAPLTQEALSSHSGGTYVDALDELSHRYIASREASVVGTDVSSTSSIRSSGRFALGKRKLENRLRDSEALLQEISLGSSSTSTPGTDISLSRFPNPPALEPMVPLDPRRFEDTPEEILTTPVRKAERANLPHEEGFNPKRWTSPLDRLRAWNPDVESDFDDDESEAEIEMVAESPVQSKLSGRRRRSRSTGDIDTEEILDLPRANLSRQKSVDKRKTMPNMAFKAELDKLIPQNNSFAQDLDHSLDEVYVNRDRKYVVRERYTVYANDGRVATIGQAGDVDTGNILTRRRQSNGGSLRHKASVRSTRGTGVRDNLAGMLFVKLLSADLLDVPIPVEQTEVEYWLSNGKSRVRAATMNLKTSTMISKEFELNTATSTQFTIEIVVPLASPTNAHLLKPSIPVAFAPPSPTKKSFFNNIFHRKTRSEIVPPPPLPKPQVKLLQFISNKNILLRSNIRFAEHASQCLAKVHQTILPFEAPEGVTRKAHGTLTLAFFFLPRIPHAVRDNVPMPRSLEAARSGLELADEELKLSYEGILTQLGGDCSTWKRRRYQIKGTKLVPYSEVTKKAIVEYNLVTATSLVDPDIPRVPGTPRAMTYDDEEDPYRMDHSFKILFRDDTEISFYADSAKEKEEWLAILGKIIGTEGRGKSAPRWAVMYREMEKKQPPMPPARQE